MSEKPTQQISEAVKAEKIASPSKVTPDEKLDTSPKEKKAKTENSKSSKSQTKDSAKKNNVFTITIVSLIALCALGLAGYDFWFLQKQIPVVSHTLETQNSLQTRIDQLEQNLQLANTGLSKEIEARKSEQAEHQALSAAMQDVSAKLGRSTVAWRMAEVEYLLTVANHRLILAQDRETAIAVFETADNRLKAIGDTALLKVRKAIADELIALRGMPEVDIPGLALRVGSIADSIEQLPLKDKKRIAVAMTEETKNKPNKWQDIPMTMWNDLKSLVQVRRHQQPTEPLLPPSEAWFLYQNLTLKLEQARLAVLRRDTDLFRQDINEAVNWMANYFEAESPAVQSSEQALKAMLNIELQPAVPDVSGSLRLLREVMKQQSELAANSREAATK
jgi:uroporphyrin-3 C-methyltransferase